MNWFTKSWNFCSKLFAFSMFAYLLSILLNFLYRVSQVTLPNVWFKVGYIVLASLLSAFCISELWDLIKAARLALKRKKPVDEQVLIVQEAGKIVEKTNVNNESAVVEPIVPLPPEKCEVCGAYYLVGHVNPATNEMCSNQPSDSINEE